MHVTIKILIYQQFKCPHNQNQIQVHFKLKQIVSQLFIKNFVCLQKISMKYSIIYILATVDPS